MVNLRKHINLNNYENFTKLIFGSALLCADDRFGAGGGYGGAGKVVTLGNREG